MYTLETRTNGDVGFDAPATGPVTNRQEVTGNGPATPLETPESTLAGSDDGSCLPVRHTPMAIKPQAHDVPWLRDRLQEYPGTGEVRGHISSETHFHEVNGQYLGLLRRRRPSFTADDSTMPTMDAQKVHYVHQLLHAILDFSDVHKTRRVSDAKGTTVSDMIGSVVGVPLSNIELELLAWQVLVRFPSASSVCVSGRLTPIDGGNPGSEGRLGHLPLGRGERNKAGGISVLRGPLERHLWHYEGEYPSVLMAPGSVLTRSIAV